MLTNKDIPKVSEFHYNIYDDENVRNLFYLCMNYIRDSGFELSKRGYNTKPLSDLINYFEDELHWEYDPNVDGYTLLSVNPDKNMSEVDEMHELLTAIKCLNTLEFNNYINNKQWKSVKDLYEQAYNDCIKVLCEGWKRGEPIMLEEPIPYNQLCVEQKIINESNKTTLCSVFD